MKHHFGEFIESNPKKKKNVKKSLNDADAAAAMANDDDVVMKICLELGFVKEFDSEVLDMLTLYAESSVQWKLGKNAK